MKVGTNILFSDPAFFLSRTPSFIQLAHQAKHGFRFFKLLIIRNIANGILAASIDRQINGRASGDLFQLPLKNELPGRQLAIIHSEQMPVSNAARQFMSYF